MSEAKNVNSTELLACPFCGTQPIRKVSNDILSVTCPNCVSIGFHNHVRFGCRADAEWNTRANAQISCVTPSAESDCHHKKEDKTWN